MDLNTLPAAPAPKPLRVMRLPSVMPIELDVPDIGESLPEGAGFDEGHPISPEEREALRAAGYSDEDIDLISQSGPEVENDEPDKIMGAVIVDKGFTNEEWETNPITLRDTDYTRNAPTREPGSTRHRCFVEPCTWYLDVPPVPPDMGSIMGGPSVAALEQAREVEELLTEHLASHTLTEWAVALKQAQNERQEALAASVSRIQAGYGDVDAQIRTQVAEGYIPGPAQRSPERQAAVDALDARLGRSRPPQSPGDVAARDEELRRRRAERRARQKDLTPWDLTPTFTGDPHGEMSGIVTIKR